MVNSIKYLTLFLLLHSGMPPWVLINARESGEVSSELSLKQVYESRRMQLDFLISRQQPADSLALLLRDEIDLFAGQDDWETALDLIDQATELITISDPIPPQLSENPPLQSWQWTLEMGTDYSRQEYEMSFIESDSVVLEQLSNPFAAVRLSRSGLLNRNHYQLYQYVRGDQDLLQSSFSLGLEAPDFNRYWRLETQSDLFWQHGGEAGSFWENQFQGSANLPLGPNWRFLLDSRLRYKLHFPQDSTFGNVLSGEMNLSLRRYLHYLSWLEFSVSPSHYRENQLLGLQYNQMRSWLDFQHRLDFNRFFSARLSHTFRDFRSQQPSGDQLNTFNRFEPAAKVELPIAGRFGVAGTAGWEIRRYSEPSASYSDFNASSFSLSLKYYLMDYNSIGVGGVYESETHLSPSADLKTLIEQENFYAGGVVLSVDLLNSSGLLISLNYQFTLRTYPNTTVTDVFSLFSNRRIHSLQGIAFIPIGRHWQMQFFANYDNDRDRDREANDNFSTIFNGGLSYNF